MTTSKYYEAIESAPKHLEGIAFLFSWSENYSYPSPATLFLDLTNYSEEFIGQNLCTDNPPLLGYLEQDLLGRALIEWAARPAEALEFVSKLLDLEGQDD